MVPSTESLLWALIGLAAGLFLAMAGFALMVWLERLRLRTRLRATKRAGAALAEAAPLPEKREGPPLFAAPVPAVKSLSVPVEQRPVAAPQKPALPEPKTAEPILALVAKAGPAEVAGPAEKPTVVSAPTVPVTTAEDASPPEEPAAPAPADQPLPKGIQAAVAEAAKRRRVQRAIERGEPLPPEPPPLPAPASARAVAVPAKQVPAWMRPAPPVADDAEGRRDVDVGALFEKAFGETTQLTDEKSGREAGLL